MRNQLVFAFFSCVLHLQSYPMDTPAAEKTWTWEIFHIIDQWTDPLSYFTDPRAPKVCDEVMRFGLPGTDSKYREYTGDEQCLDDVKSALKRQRALISSLETECLKDNGSKVELLRDAYDRQKGYYSQNVLALIESYLERSTHTARNTAHILDKQAGKTLEAAPIPTHLSSMEPINETRAVTYKTIEELVTGTPGMWGNTVNYVRKNYIDPLKYLNDEKAQSISLAMRYLHPRHVYHSEQWQFNNKLDFHRKLIHQALERETKLTQALQHALEKKKPWMIVSINPENPDLKSVMANIASSYSPIVCAIIKGFLISEANKKEREVKEKENKEREQKELTEKNHAISTLMHSLGRKFSDPYNKGKLDIERVKYDALRSTIVSRSLNPQEVLEKHAQLADLSRSVDQLLASSASNSPSPSLNNSATSLPPFVPAIPAPKAPAPVAASNLASIQSVVDTAHLAAATATAVTSAQLAQHTLPAPSLPAPPPLEPQPSVSPKMAKQESASTITVPNSNSQSSSVSTSEASAPSPKAESPQASPPITPGGSLVVTPANPLAKSSDEEFPDPRAPVKLASTPAAPAIQAHAKNGNRNKKGN